MRIPVLLAALSGGLLLFAQPSGSSDALAVRVVPGVVAPAPAAIAVFATVTNHEDNRVLRVVAESTDYYRSSQMELNGHRAARTSQFVFRDLPVGEYEITVILGGSRGQRAALSRAFLVTGPSNR